MGVTACRKVNSETLRDNNDSKHLEKLCSTVKKMNRKLLLYHMKDKTLCTKQLVWRLGVDNTHVPVLSLEIPTSWGSVTQNHLSNHRIFSIHVLELSDMPTASEYFTMEGAGELSPASLHVWLWVSIGQTYLQNCGQRRPAATRDIQRHRGLKRNLSCFVLNVTDPPDSWEIRGKSWRRRHTQ